MLLPWNLSSCFALVFRANIVYNAGLYPSFIGHWFDKTGLLLLLSLTVTPLTARPLCKMKSRRKLHPPETHCAAVTSQQMVRKTFAFWKEKKKVLTPLVRGKSMTAWCSEVEEVESFISQGILISSQTKRHSATRPIAVLRVRGERGRVKTKGWNVTRKGRCDSLVSNHTTSNLHHI